MTCSHYHWIYTFPHPPTYQPHYLTSKFPPRDTLTDTISRNSTQIRDSPHFLSRLRPPNSTNLKPSFPTVKMQHQKPRKFIFFFFVFMASLLSLLFMALFLSHAAPHHIRIAPNPNPPPTLSNPSLEVRRACKATRFAELCEKSLLRSDLENQPKPVDIIFAAINVSSENLATAQSMVRVIFDTAGSDKNRSGAARNCLEVLSFSQYRIGLSTSALPRGKNKDARAWMSAALLYQYDCWSALKYVNTTQRVNESMAFLNELTELTSNALAMLVSFDLYGEELDKWGPVRTERTGFWEDGGPSSGSGSELGFPAGMTADVSVCKAGCDYQTIQAAVDAAPVNLRDGGRRFVIRIKEGVYEEMVRVPLDKKNVVFLGDGMGKTVITGNLNAQMVGISTYNTATVGVAGDGFMARDLTFENTAGPDAHQAVAFRSTADYTILENCEFLGHQDTLYAHSLRQFYKACRIEGTVDFIFGNSASFFKDCLILIRPRQLKPEKGSTNTVTAHGRTDPAQWTGFAFANCTINGTEEYIKFYSKNPKAYKNYLGRPWKEYSRTVFIRCYLESIIRPEGWLPWTGDFALSTLYYGEFENTGPGGNISGRVPWSNQIPAEHVSMYSVQNFIQGDEWTPSSQY